MIDISLFMESRPVQTSKEHPIIFFDGVCGLCNRFVDWVDARDLGRVFRYAPLQGETAKKAGVVDYSTDPGQWTIVYQDEKDRWERSDAALRIISRLGGLYGFATILLYIPRFIRDGVYRLVARWRYSIFGKHETCRIPSPQMRSRFLS